MVGDTASPPRSWLRWLAPAIPVVSAFVLALTQIDDPDAFTHLALGRDLVQHHGFPAHEPFSFGSLDRPYYNSEWLFDVVFYLGYLAGGTAGVIVLKSAIVALVAWILWLDSRPGDGAAAESSAGQLLRAGVLTAVVVMMHHRFVERPDIALMVFLAFTIYALNAWIRAGRRWIFWLPVVQLLWSNTHPSIIVGLVPFVAVLGGGVALQVGARIVARWWRIPETSIPSWRRLGVVAAMLVGVLAVSVINPYRFDRAHAAVHAGRPAVVPAGDPRAAAAAARGVAGALRADGPPARELRRHRPAGPADPRAAGAALRAPRPLGRALRVPARAGRPGPSWRATLPA